MRRISRKQRCTPAILFWQGILESGKYQGNGEHQDRRPRRQQNPRSRRRHPRDQRKLVRCCDERRPDLAIVLLSNCPAFYLVDYGQTLPYRLGKVCRQPTRNRPNVVPLSRGFDGQPTAFSHCPLDGLLWGAPSNSSPIHCWKAVMFCGRPRKFFTRSLADMDPPGSSTVRR
jgi:hypothetical protein